MWEGKKKSRGLLYWKNTFLIGLFKRNMSFSNSSCASFQIIIDRPVHTSAVPRKTLPIEITHSDLLLPQGLCGTSVPLASHKPSPNLCNKYRDRPHLRLKLCCHGLSSTQSTYVPESWLLEQESGVWRCWKEADLKGPTNRLIRLW